MAPFPCVRVGLAVPPPESPLQRGPFQARSEAGGGTSKGGESRLEALLLMWDPRAMLLLLPPPLLALLAETAAATSGAGEEWQWHTEAAEAMDTSGP